MATRGRPPEGGAGKVTRTFDNVRGEVIRNGWLDGPVHGLVCHACKKSRPCLKALLGEHADCPGCKTPLKPRWIGWVPVRREDGRPWIVAISAARFEVVDAIKPGSRISWGRDPGDGQGVWVLPRDKGALWSHFYPHQKPDADLAGPMCVIWETPELLPALREYWAQQCQPVVTERADPVDVPEYPADAPPELLERDRRRRAERGGAGAGPARLGELFDRLPSANGKHKPGT